MLSLEFQNNIFFLNNISFLDISDQKKCPFTPLKSLLPPKFSKYHADVILSRLRDTSDILHKKQGCPYVCMFVTIFSIWIVWQRTCDRHSKTNQRPIKPEQLTLIRSPCMPRIIWVIESYIWKSKLIQSWIGKINKTIFAINN